MWSSELAQRVEKVNLCRLAICIDSVLFTLLLFAPNIECIVKYMYVRIRPNYRTVRLDFSKLLNKLVVKYSPNKGTLQRKIHRGVHKAFARSYFMTFFIKTYVVLV